MEEENVLGQMFEVSVTLYTNTREAAKTGELTKTIHYGEVCQRIYDFMKKHTYQLIETAAENMAQDLLLHFPNLKKVKLTIYKPWAPIGLPLETVAVTIKRKWHEAYIALGSNMGDKEKFLNDAVAALDELAECKVIANADYKETKPYGYENQDNFLNGCVKIETLLSPQELLEKLHMIENQANRKREIHWGPRTLDLDIIFYDNKIIQEPDLIIPHCDMENREFVLEPLAQLAPYKKHPVNQQTVMQMLQNLALK